MCSFLLYCSVVFCCRSMDCLSDTNTRKPWWGFVMGWFQSPGTLVPMRFGVGLVNCVACLILCTELLGCPWNLLDLVDFLALIYFDSEMWLGYGCAVLLGFCPCDWLWFPDFSWIDLNGTTLICLDEPTMLFCWLCTSFLFCWYDPMVYVPMCACLVSL
jgi:hypothetical protein